MKMLVALTVAALMLGGCANHREGKPQNTLNEASVTSGTGNTGAAGATAAGPNVNSQSATEAAREAQRR